MKEVTLKILAEDIENSDYRKADDCAMTRAFRRANLNIRESGDIIIDSEGSIICHTPDELSLKVKAMYKYLNTSRWLGYEDSLIVPIRPADFEYKMSIPIGYEIK